MVDLQTRLHANCDIPTVVKAHATVFKGQAHTQTNEELTPIFLLPTLPSLLDGDGSLCVRCSQNDNSMVVVAYDGR